MSVRFAFVGFRHPHINDMYQRCCERQDIDVVACCEEDATTRNELAAAGSVVISHDDFGAMLREVDCDVIAVGETFRPNLDGASGTFWTIVKLSGRCDGFPR